MKLATLIALAAIAAEVRAETAPVAPVAQGNTEVPYPSGATGDAEVTLELVVENDGTISSVVVVEGDEPFARAAREAAASWRFLPARRDGVAIRARMRARVGFHPPGSPDDTAASPPPEPAVDLAGPAPGERPSNAAAEAAPRPTPPATPPPDERPLEVTIRGDRRPAGQTTLSDAEVRALPGAFGDAFRAVEALPSVVPVVSGFPYFFIRGAPPNDNGYFIDGVRVPLLFHLGIGQAVIHPGLIDRVDFFPGTAPASYGGVVGGIIAGQTKEPAPALRGQANLRLVDAGALVESPVAGHRGSVLVAGRYGYPGPILGAITPGLDLTYWDYQARLTWRLTDRDTVGLLAFGSRDHLATPSPSSDPTAKPIEQMSSQFHRVDLRYDHALSDGHLRVALTGGHERQGAAPTYIRDHSAAARLQVETRLSPRLRVRAGARAQLDAYGFTQNPTGPNDPPVPSTADPPPTDVLAGAHAEVTWQLGSRLELTPGARFDLFASSRATAPGASTRVRTQVPAFDPRLSARVTITPSMALLSALGVAHQYPALRVGGLPAVVLTVPGFPPGARQLQVALQASQGVEVGLPADVVVTATGFVARLSGLTDLTSMCLQGGEGAPEMPPTYVCPDSQPVTGRSYGLEILARRTLSRRLGGWLSYTLSRSTRDARFITPDGGVAQATVPSDADRRHVLNVALSLELGASWRLGGRGLYYTGTPYSRLEGVIPVPPYAAYRTPSFFRLDLRLEKRWRLANRGSIALVIEGLNVTLATEYSGQALDCMGGVGMATQCKLGKIGPLTLPSVGVEAFF